ncbi:SRPBCC family protein [Pseudoxanthomonas sp.]|uniref:SRPBCC family protein n=1 Tax=Pseudoxanthomonas sp. TaxID=1871049 RepID=UPI00262A2394|nr:SRPBCC family protein [Pseudoxanthomonas sp.]WDS36276.1 MAG: SRPBCC family protein [Pseudoxanthomonas sp.]
MTRLLEFLIALALVLALFLIIGVVLPSHRHLEGSVESNRKMTIVYDTVSNVRRLKDWSVMLPGDPALLTYSGGADGNTGKGAKVDFTSPVVTAWKKGSWEITDAQAPGTSGNTGKVVYAITDDAPGGNKVSEITLAPTGKGGRNVRVTQSYDVDYGWNIYGRFLGMYVKSQIGDGMDASLAKLGTNLATIPNFDYRVEGSKLTDLKISDVPSENLLVVGAGSIARSNDAIKKSILANQEWIKRVMESNDLEPAGPFRIVTTELASQTYTFDLVQPVRKKGTGPKTEVAKSDDKGEDKADATAAAEPAPEAAPATDAAELQVKVAGTPVTYLHTEAHKAATAKYTGYMSELDVARNGLRAWALTNGHAMNDRPYESWNSGVDKSFTDESSTYDIFWAIKY